jgi:hypothetical protein
MALFNEISDEIVVLVGEWESKLLSLSQGIVTERRNNQNRSIKQIVGHMVDSASNNTHRAVHLQYQLSPFDFPNYATSGNNDRWIAIQNYQDEEWVNLVQLWKYSLLHFAHVIRNVDETKLDNEWIANPDRNITLKEMIMDFNRHLSLHLSEIEELINVTQ